MRRQPIRLVKKPWGEERWFADTRGYAGKLLYIRKGCRLSLQYHRRKDETIFVDRGRLRLTLASAPPRFKTGRILPSRVVGPGAAFRIAPGMIHRFEAVTDCRLIEVSAGPLTDVVRLQDDYGRS